MNIHRRIGAYLAPVALAAGLLTSAAAPASATQDTCIGVDVMVGTDDCVEDAPESFSEAHSSTKVSSTQVNGVDIKSKTKVVSYIKANGAPKAQMRGKKYTLKNARRIWTSYLNIYKQEVWHWKSYPKGYTFVKGSDGYWHDPKCWNKVVGIPQGKSHVGTKIYGKIKVVKKFNFESIGVAKVSDYVKAHALAWANATGCHAEAEAWAEASFFAKARAVAKGSVFAKVLAKAKANANDALSVKLGGKTVVQIHAQTKASARGEATADATARAKCESTPPPPPGNKPPTGEIVQWPAHLFPGGLYRAKVVGSDPEDGANVDMTYTVTGGAHKVVDADHPEICDAEANNWVCTFWIQAGPNSGVDATLTLKVTDSKGLTFTSSKTWPIVPDEF